MLLVGPAACGNDAMIVRRATRLTEDMGKAGQLVDKLKRGVDGVLFYGARGCRCRRAC